MVLRNCVAASKDPHDWNIRVRGWAFSKRSNRRKRLVMSMARKIAGVTKDDNKLYETLESRFGMFLASNSKNARFSIQCVGAAETTHMELAGDPYSNNPTVDELLDDAKSEEGEKAFKETRREKQKLRNALWTGQDISQIQADDPEPAATTTHSQPDSNLEPTEDRLQQQQPRAAKAMDTSVQDTTPSGNECQSSPYRPMEMKASAPGDYAQRQQQSDFAPSVEGESRLSERLTRGAVMLKDTFKKYKSNILSERFNHSTDSLSSRQGSNVSDGSGDESGSGSTKYPSQPPSSMTRTESEDSVQSQSHTYLEDLGHGMLPTVQISTRIGGHFHGTLRVTEEEVGAMAKRQLNLHQGEVRFLKLQAFHEDMPEECHGVVNLIEPEGISVISDIDDTIKETNVPAGARIILRNTFLSDMQEVEGMAQVYRDWWQRGAAIHYVSNSPWQLIPSLLEFFHSHEFPPGSAHLRLHDSVIKTYFMTPGEHKRRSIREILEDFPNRKFILVGDSGEIDLEIYTEMAVRYPHQIRKIFIRDITTTRLQEMVVRMPTTRAPSFTSLIHKVPVHAVTSRLGFLVNRNGGGNNGTQGNGRGEYGRKQRADSGSSHDSQASSHASGDFESRTSMPSSSSYLSSPFSILRGGSNGPDVEDEKNMLSEEPEAMADEATAQSNTASRQRRQLPSQAGQSSSSLHHSLKDLALDASELRLLVREPSQAQRKPDVASANEYPFPKVDDPSNNNNNTLHLPGQFPFSSSPSGSLTPGQSPLHSPQWGVYGSTNNNNGNGSDNGQPVPKNPLEVWLERVEACRRQLPEGMLTFFESSEALEQDPLVQQLLDDFERSQQKK
ncbi:hypothetical protein BGW42_005557 [Actinomortierella wolfii]|nr:hypothetical protein BGW42_005557 [Actinomortierella wolfii]